ncbi:MAG: hypothetical protein ACIAQU_04650 [Phycisphaerales bacterium JB064]
MYRPTRTILPAGLALLCACGSVCAQQGEQRFEAYLDRYELREVEAADLRYRFESAPVDQRARLAKRLADLYVEMLGLATTPQERQRLEQLGQRLTRQLPEEASGDLRLALVRARYQWAKEVAERARLNVVPADDLQEAERTLRSLVPELSSIAQTASDAAYRLDRRRTSVGLDEQEQDQLETAARVRSTAHYLLGWSRYYLAVMTGGQRFASDALQDLGVLLGAETNRPASVERADERMMRFDHVADAAIAAAFCESFLGNADTALRWLDKIESAATLSEGIRDRLFVCRLLVFGEAGRWRDLAYHSDLRRRSRRADGKPGLEPLESQLLAHVSWEALTKQRLVPRDRSVLEEIAHAAIQDLVRQNQVQVLRSLVEQFGTASLEGEGFIFAFVRGQNAYERATDAYEAAGYTDGQIAQADNVANLYSDAVRSLDAALNAEDARRFPNERAQAMQLAAMAAYLSGQVLDAADRFERAHEVAEDTEQGERALWHAIVALDAAIRDGDAGQEARRDRLVTLYLQSFPGTERAARLLVARAGAASNDDPKAIDILLNVEPDSPLYESARRRAERLLYAKLRTLTGDARSAAALRYLTVADELLNIERRRAATGDMAAASESADRALALSRAMLQVILGSSVPDVQRAEDLLKIVEELRLRVGAPPSTIESEIAFRRLQVALAKDDAREAQRLARTFDNDDGAFKALSARAMYAWAAEKFRDSPENREYARQVVDFGQPVIAELGSDNETLKTPQAFGVNTTVSRAAWLLSRGDGDGQSQWQMLDLVLAIDGRLVAADVADSFSLVRYAYASEHADRNTDALDAWRRLLAGAAEGSSMALRARYESARLLAAEDTPRAIDALRQHLLLYPGSPEPWATRLAELLEAMEKGRDLPPPALEDAP